MRNIIGLAMVLGTCVACTTQVGPPSVVVDPLNDPALECRTVVGQVEIDGTAQPIVARACRQPDGTWQVVQDGYAQEFSYDGAVAVYPLPAYAYWPYYDPWYWGAPVFVGIGGSFIFVDHFHHFHHMGHGHFGHPYGGMGTHGGVHSMGGVLPAGGGMAGGAGRH